MRPQASATYQQLQAELGRGWNTWDTRSVMRHVRLPDGLAVSLGLHELYRGRTLSTAQIGRRGDDEERVHLGPHAIHGEYTEASVSWAGVTIDIRTAQLGDDLVILVTPTANQTRPALLTIGLSLLWNRPGTCSRDQASLVGETPAGSTTVFVDAEPVQDPYADQLGPYLSVELAGPIAISTGRPRTATEVTAAVDRARQQHCPTPTGRDGELLAAVRDAISWNTLYEPMRERVVTTVSRLWNVQKRGGFALFCWDSFFNALLADAHSTEMAYVNAIEMCREVTPAGFVPNVAQGTGRVTYDGSQPPVGSMVCWELYRRHGDEWFLREVFDVLVSWNRWWWSTRRTGELLTPGSTVFQPEFPSPQDIPRIGKHFGATCETGADDHPAFRDIPFDEATGLLGAHDIGLNAEYAMDCEALSAIATALGETDIAAEVADRGRQVATSIEQRLWDDETGTYRSHFTDSGTPTAYLSPMSFFPLLAGGGADGRAVVMTRRYLQNENEFGGKWVLPSSPRRELAAGLGEHTYWVGRAWPPINFLVWLGLSRAGLTADADWLAERSAELFLAEWRENRHIHENYSSEHGFACDKPNSEPFHSWGAVLCLPALIAGGAVPWLSAPGTAGSAYLAESG